MESALAYMQSCQRDDGGFGEDGRETSPATSTWVIMAIVAAGEDPDTWTKNGVSAIDYLHAVAAPETVAIDGTAETAKMILTILAVGEDPYTFEGTDFVASLKAKQEPSGSFGDHIYTTNWAVMALAAAGEDTSAATTWLTSRQNADGGFGWTPGAESDCDDTASAVEALIAAGTPRSAPVITNAVGFFRDVQCANGGFNYGGSSAANTASDAWVIQALVAAGENPATWTKEGATPVSHLLSAQAGEGYFKWTPVLTDNPCRMTASAVPALLGHPYPVLPGAGMSAASTGSAISPAATGAAVNLSSPSPVPTSAVPAGGPVTVTDDFGRTVTVQGVPQRIVSLAPSNTEIVYAVGAGDRVVGVTDYCNYPAATADVEKVGGYSSVNIEKVVAAQPDLVLAALGNSEEVVNYIEGLGLTVVSLNPASIQGVVDDVRLVGTVTGNAQEAEAIASSMEARIAAVRTKAAAASSEPTVAHVVWYDPIWVSGSETFQDEMFEIAHAKNAFPNVEGWQVVGLEDFITTNPDIILVNSGSGMGDGGYDLIYSYMMEEPRLQGVTAIREGRVYIAESDMIDRGGPRIVDALEEVAADIHPEIFGAASTPTPETTQSPLPLAGALGGCIAMGILGLRGRGRA
ncbi:ABC transporter substrate-binding protein [Methanomicrobiaceae archaeon CYW5]|nr:ABC transporter substrate-binding protein [Methanovulcanius yangii]